MDFKSATNNYPQHDSHISPPCNFTGNNLSPITDHTKVSFDGAWLVVLCSASLGVIRKIVDGHFGGWLAEKKIVSSALCAEAEAALLGISMARDLGDCKVIFKSDSKILISSINGNMGSGAWTILPLIREIRRRSSFFDYVEWRWIPHN
ncbi:unnamed protein product [Prunus armeniaca]|uniref:RNase H type-1 domain-containing protein n=1 Tax=Prunus armeniaca TaxID=36596 RepID=A0A6J5WNW1_PRUAR|nr:unnamed protein product [Prunus armeniaca]